MGKKILVVDDEKNITSIIQYNLVKEGYDVICAYDGEQGLDMALSEMPDLVLLDIMMPKRDGFEVCRKLREKHFQAPIIMLTARAEEIDKVLGFELGADDYVTKPFGARELSARIKSHLRRKDAGQEPEEVKTMQFGDIAIHLDRYEVTKRGEALPLTPREFELIKFLAKNKPQVFSRESLLSQVWGFEYFGDVRTVDVTIRRLRSKVEDNPETPFYVLTKRGVGYYFSN